MTTGTQSVEWSGCAMIEGEVEYTDDVAEEVREMAGDESDGVGKADDDAELDVEWFIERVG